MKATRAFWAVALVCLAGLALANEATATTPVPSAHAPCGAQLQTSVIGDTLYLSWTGHIQDPMSECIWAEFEKAKAEVTTRAVLLTLDSPGGYLPMMERTISVLRKVRKTHRLDTMVHRGKTCGSACIPVFLAGQRRWGALTSSWLFHEVGQWIGKEGNERTVLRSLTERMFQDYFLPAGVSEHWLNRVRPLIQHADYWQTGQNLWDDKSGIITRPIDNLTPRGTERRIH
jgi:hypothetical protein